MPDLLRVKKLLSQGHAYLGMVEEARMRTVLLRQRLLAAREDGTAKEQIGDIQAKSDQIRRDIDKYSNKILRINEELDSYGDFSELE